jgi:hypothetical protein
MQRRSISIPKQCGCSCHVKVSSQGSFPDLCSVCRKPSTADTAVHEAVIEQQRIVVTLLMHRMQQMPYGMMHDTSMVAHQLTARGHRRDQVVSSVATASRIVFW